LRWDCDLAATAAAADKRDEAELITGPIRHLRRLNHTEAHALQLFKTGNVLARIGACAGISLCGGFLADHDQAATVDPGAGAGSSACGLRGAKP
jgi:hypothetical protein